MIESNQGSDIRHLIIIISINVIIIITAWVSYEADIAPDSTPHIFSASFSLRYCPYLINAASASPGSSTPPCHTFQFDYPSKLIYISISNHLSKHHFLNHWPLWCPLFFTIANLSVCLHIRKMLIIAINIEHFYFKLFFTK